MSTSLQKVISGGQTGADVGGVLAARLHGLKTGGWMPLGWKTLNGPRPEYAKLFDMQEHQDPGYKARTWENVYDSDGTIRIAANFNSAGEKCTLNGIRKYDKPYIDVEIIESVIYKEDVVHVAEWMTRCEIKTLNVAGNSHRTWQGMQAYTTKFLSYVFLELGFPRGTLCQEYSSLAVLGW